MKISGEHTTLTYTFLFSSAKNTYETGIGNVENSFYYFLASIVMSAFSFEAYMNHCGKALFDDLLIDDFNLFEKKKPLEKFKIVSSLINLKIDKKTSPYKSLPLLFKLRNALAHGKTSTIKSDFNIDDYKKVRDKLRRTIWEEACDKQNAKIFLADVESIIRLIHKRLFENNDPFLFTSTGRFGEQ